MRKQILLLICIFSVGFSYADFDMNNNMREAYSNIISLNFQLAQEMIDQEKISNPENGLIYLNENYIDFLTLLISEDKSLYSSRKLNKNRRLNNLRKNNKETPYYLFSQAEIHLQWAFTRIKFKEYFLAAYELQKAYKLLKKNNQLYPDFMLNKKSMGLLHVLIGSVPDSYDWVLNIIGIEGNINVGFNELYSFLDYSERTNKYRIYENETLFLLSFLEMNMNNDLKACEILLDKIKSCCLKDNLLVFCAARLSNKLGNNDETINILERRKFSDSKFQFHYLDYLYAMSKFYKLEFNSAKEYFLKFTSNFKGKNYIKSAYHKLSLIAFLEDSLAQREYYHARILNYGEKLIDEDRQAENDIQNDIVINRDLLIARILFDGGYYNETLNKLNKLSVNEISLNNDLSIEYYYRLARTNQKLLNNQVIDLFLKVLSYDNYSNLYYHPMSTLQIGLEFEKEGNKDEAIRFFKKTLSYNDFNYENGIKKSAKAGINRLLN
ncbi:MAG: hypothetical protein P8J77_04035 [Flavobacteriales bacterium]|nr:hypothetical protein [Flavobacteriales bacterium]